MRSEDARRHLAVVAAAVMIAVAIWGLARLLGVELTVGKGRNRSPVGVIDVLVVALLAGLESRSGIRIGRSGAPGGTEDPQAIGAPTYPQMGQSFIPDRL